MKKGFLFFLIAMLEIKKSTEFGKDSRTVRNNKKKYIALKYTDSITKYWPRGYGVRYIEVEEIVKYLKEKWIIK